jgi:hypothetical protein
VYEEGGVGKSSDGEDSGSATAQRGGAAVLQLRRRQHWGRRQRRWGRRRGRLTGVERRWRSGAEVGHPDSAKPRDSAIRVSCRRGYSPYTQSFFVPTELCQLIPIMILLVSADLIQPIPIIFHIDWVTSADTNKPPPINTAHTPLFRLSTTVAAATVPTEISFFKVFSAFSNMFLPFFCHGIYRSWFWFHHDISYGSRIVPMYPILIN